VIHEVHSHPFSKIHSQFGLIFIRFLVRFSNNRVVPYFGVPFLDTMDQVRDHLDHLLEFGTTAKRLSECNKILGELRPFVKSLQPSQEDQNQFNVWSGCNDALVNMIRLTLFRVRMKSCHDHVEFGSGRVGVPNFL